MLRVAVVLMDVVVVVSVVVIIRDGNYLLS